MVNTIRYFEFKKNLMFVWGDWGGKVVVVLLIAFCLTSSAGKMF